MKAQSILKLKPELIVETIDQLEKRISERFPNAGLARVCGQLKTIGQRARSTAADIAAPSIRLRIVIFSLVVGLVIVSGYMISQLEHDPQEPWTLRNFVEFLDACMNDIIIAGAALLFLTTIENRWKRHKALNAIHELRSLAHIIDMHQLTKDPERVSNPTGLVGVDTPSSPKRAMNAFELGRYLDYCTEMLSLTGKIAALYVEHFPDPQSVAAVNDLEDLTTGLSRKIWQKITILHKVVG